MTTSGDPQGATTMTARTEFVVQAVRVHRNGSRGNSSRWTNGINVEPYDQAQWQPTEGFTVAAFVVECPTKSEAAGVVMAWLAKGRPAAMTGVRQVWPRVLVRPAVAS